MIMLLQLHGDLPEYFPEHERRLYIFACRKKACQRKEGSIRTIRSVKVLKALGPSSKSASPVTQFQHNLGYSLFGKKAEAISVGNLLSPPAATKDENPFSSNSSESPSLSTNLASQASLNTITNDLSTTFAQKARISSSTVPAETTLPFETWPTELPPAYPQYNLDADYETLDVPENPAVSTPAMDYDETSGSSSRAASEKEDPELFEITMDKTFQRFADRLAYNPLQVLRYEFRGLPLLYSKSDEVGKRLSSYQPSSQNRNTKVSASGRIGITDMPPCANCGSARVFEFQLTPQAICELEVDEIGLDGMDWGPLIVGVCGEDCQTKGMVVGQVGYLEEWVGVQWEEASGKTREGVQGTKKR